MTRQRLILIAAFGSAALLTGAFGFQYIAGLWPCTLCLWQRWPHAAAIVLGVLGITLPQRIWPILGAVAALATAAIALFHVGVEQTWWEGLATCTADTMGNVNVDDLLNTNVTVGAPVRCDAIAWTLFGISMAGWNMLLSMGLAVIWIKAARKG
jgi:disulfide bond formation protein DsbB